VLTILCEDYRSVDTQENVNTTRDLHEEADAGVEELPPLNQARRAFERGYLVRILTLTAGNVTRAARLAGRNRTEFYRLLERHGLSPSAFKPPRRGEARALAAAEPAAQR
jgi:DNA-binding NtrC family response regulator